MCCMLWFEHASRPLRRSMPLFEIVVEPRERAMRLLAQVVVGDSIVRTCLLLSHLVASRRSSGVLLNHSAFHALCVS